MPPWICQVGLGVAVGVSTEDDRNGASAQDPGEAREREIMSGPWLVTWASPAGLELIFCDYISLPHAALKAPFSGFSLFFFSALLAGDDGGEDGEWRGLN